MKYFTNLYLQIDGTTKSSKKIEALVQFFNLAHDQDKVWLVALFSGKRPKRIIKTSQLKEWIQELVSIPEWLFTNSYHVVGDLAETISLLLPAQESTNQLELFEIINKMESIRDAEDSIKKQFILDLWSTCSQNEAFIVNKLITGGFRIGVSQKSILKALGKHLQKDESLLAHRLMGTWDPFITSFYQLVEAESANDDLSKPYPFYLAYALDSRVEDLGSVEHWYMERKWDGIRGQIILRKNEIFIWSRGEELVTEKFPEFESFKNLLDTDCVLDGEIIAGNKNNILPFNTLQTRIGRKNLSKKILENAPASFIVYDLLELNGKDLRSYRLIERKELLEQLLSKVISEHIWQSPRLTGKEWNDFKNLRAKSRENNSEGLMLKSVNSKYEVGRKKGSWWKWKIDPLTIDAVLIYAMRGHGRRANLYTDYTFAVWNGEELVSFTKAYSGLTDKELKEVDRFVKKNTIDRFGPVRSVKPELVFELAFEGISKSTRHKSGVALRFPRILRWRRDKSSSEANTLNDLNQLLKIYG